MKQHRIIIDGRAIIAQTDGIARYSLNLIREIIRQGRQFSYIILIRDDLETEKFAEYFSEAKTLRIPYSHINPRTLFDLGRLADSLDADLYHSLFMMQPFFMKIPGIITIHDTMWFRKPWLQAENHILYEMTGWAYYRAAVGMSAKKACRIIAVSEATKNDLCDWRSSVCPKVRVVHEGVDNKFSETILDADIRPNHLGLRKRGFFLHPSNGKPYKNTFLLLKAYAAARSDMPLVIIGRKSAFSKDMERQIEALGIRQFVRFLGSVSDTDVAVLFRNALALLFPSVYEGFGLPILEAMSAGTPVITSDLSAMPEVAGDAALLTNPYSVSAMSDSILRIARDESLRNTLSEKGKKRSALFTWEKAAMRIWSVYDEVLASKR